MQQDNNIQNKLQQLENQQLPDLSHMDEHWQQMQATLQAPGSTGGKVINMNRWLWSITGIALIVAAIFITTHFVNKNNDQKFATKTIQTKKIEENKNAAAIISANPSIDSLSTATLIAEKKLSLAKRFSVTNATKKDVAHNHNDVTLLVKIDSSTSTLKTIAPDKQSILNNLLKDLEKKAQEFTIDNSKDTLLTGEEGSSLLIPANTLGGNKEVKITLKEFYKQSDIILNKLSTTSNGNQLVTGGMVQITATVNGQPVNIQPNKAIRLYLPDTSSERMQQMQLFMGEEKAFVQKQSNGQQDFIPTKTMQINWIPKSQYFQKQILVKKVRVFNLSDGPFKVDEVAKGSVAYFKKADDSKFTRKELAQMLKLKYGYYKVKIRNSWADTYVTLTGKTIPSGEGAFFDRGIGDTIWTTPKIANMYKLAILDSMSYWSTSLKSSYNPKVDNMLGYFQKDKQDVNNKQNVFKDLQNKYYIDINSLGWINCDHFLDRPKLVEYAVNLKDSAANYYTMLVFTNIKSILTGYISGNEVTFQNVPEGESIKIVSIGINKNGQPIMAIKETTISKEEETGLQFEEIASGNIKSSLSQMDK